MSTHAFIHIPKTGGTSIEAHVPHKLTVRYQVEHCCDWWRGKNKTTLSECCKPGSPWHMAPDVMEDVGGPVNSSLYARATALVRCAKPDFYAMAE